MIKETFIKNNIWFIYNTLKKDKSPEFISIDLTNIKCIQAETDSGNLHIRFYTSYEIEESKTCYNWNVTYSDNEEGKEQLNEDLLLVSEIYKQYILGEREINCDGEVIKEMTKIESR